MRGRPKLPETFWIAYRADLENWLEGKRLAFVGLYLTFIGLMAVAITLWCLTLVILLFLYSLYPAYQISKPTDRPAAWTC